MTAAGASRTILRPGESPPTGREGRQLNIAPIRSSMLLGCAVAVVLVGGVVPAAAADQTSPSLTIAFAPQEPQAGSLATITATVTPGTNPDSTGLAVTCDLSWVGLGPSESLVPGADGTFALQFLVPSDSVPGPRVGRCGVTDDDDRSGSTLYFVTVAGAAPDAAPSVASHTPAAGAVDVPPGANIGITFSEPVDVTGSWFAIECTSSGSHEAAPTGGPTAFLLDPAADFSAGESCTVTLDGSVISDQDSNDPPNTVEGSPSWTFTTASPVNQPPSVAPDGPFSVDEGSAAQLGATGSDPEGAALTYAWDLNDDGVFETPGKTVSFAAPDGPATPTVRVEVTDAGGLTATAAAVVDVGNVPPTATLEAPASSSAGFPFALALTSPHDPSAADTAAGFSYAFDCGSGYGAFGSASTASCPTSDVGTRFVRGKIRDKDGGVTEYRGTVRVTVTVTSLCDLVRSYSTDPKVADDLCAKLAQAQSAPTASARAGLLGAFRNQADAKVDKGLTAEQAAELELLSTRL